MKKLFHDYYFFEKFAPEFIEHVKQALTSFAFRWKEYLSGSFTSLFFGVALVELLLASKYCKHYIGVFASRGGMLLHDPLLVLYTPRDFSTIIFILFHGILIVSFISLLNKPRELAIAFQAYALLMIFRTFTIYMIPLQAPKDMIFLSDPLANMYMHSNGNGPVVNDLFFSGHVSSSFLFFLVAQGKVLKRIILAATIVVAVLILWQKVHYTVDVVFAPLFSLLALYISTMLARKVHSFSAVPSASWIREETAKP